jgi:DNA-binding NtrC family response regulator
LRSTHCDVLLIAADWQSRTLLLAELREAGYSVIVAPALRYAYRALLGQRVHPKVIVLDVSGDEEATPGYVEPLLALAPGSLMILLAGAPYLAAWQPLRDHAVEVLRRPLTVGEAVEAVRRGLGGA